MVKRYECILEDHYAGGEYAVMNEYDGGNYVSHEDYAILEAALIRLRDCDWVITPRDRMDAVREIAREALSQVEKTK